MELIILYVALFAVVWFVFIRPQQNRAKEQRALLSQVAVGDEVLTAAGIYGKITEFDGPTVFLAVSDNLEIKVTRESIAERVVYADPVDDDIEDDSDVADDEAKK